MLNFTAVRKWKRGPVAVTNSSLRNDILDVLETRAEIRLLTVLGRGGKARHFTGAQIRMAAEHMQARWSKALGPGPKVLIAALPAGEDFLVSLVASLLDEGTLVPVALPRVGDSPDRLRRMVTTCNAAVVLCHRRNHDAIAAQLQGACPILVLDAADEEVLRPQTVQNRQALPHVIIQHTSGSTRFPKAVPVGAEQIRTNSELIRTLWGLGSDAVVVNWLPHYHDMGLMGCIIYPLLSGAYSVQMNPFDMIRQPLNWLSALSSFRGTMSGGPAFAFHECLARITPEESRALDLSSWDCAFCGAEPVPAGLLDRFSERFGPNGLAPRAVFPCYGMAEYTLFAAGEPASKTLSEKLIAPQRSELPKAWQAVESCRLSECTQKNLRIVDPNTLTKLPDGVEGEIWLSGGSLCHGYQKQPQETAQAFVVDDTGRQWLRTGDLGGVLDKHLFITGRIKDMVIVNGRNVAASEIEWIAAQEERGLNASAAAAFMPDINANGCAVLFIEWRSGAVLTTDTEALAERIRRSVLSRSGVALSEVRFMRRGALPRTTSGKIRRAQVRVEFVGQGEMGRESSET